jgi:hypothetical protein
VRLLSEGVDRVCSGDGQRLSCGRDTFAEFVGGSAQPIKLLAYSRVILASM